MRIRPMGDPREDHRSVVGVGSDGDRRRRSGPATRPVNPAWVRDLRDQSLAAEVLFTNWTCCVLDKISLLAIMAHFVNTLSRQPLVDSLSSATPEWRHRRAEVGRPLTDCIIPFVLLGFRHCAL